jgi:hypothetical protein
LNFGGEIIYQFSPAIGVGLGVGYLSASKESTMTYSPPVANVDFYWKGSPSAIPITANFYYFVPAGGSLKFYFNLGLGYYIAKANFLHHSWFLAPFRWDAKTSGGGLGFHGGVGLEFDFNPTFGLIFELKGRYASFSNFNGDVIWTFPAGGTPSTETGDLWAVEVDGKTWLWISASTPAGDNPRQAKVDFSGFSAVIGFVIHI